LNSSGDITLARSLGDGDGDRNSWDGLKSAGKHRTSREDGVAAIEGRRYGSTRESGTGAHRQTRYCEARADRRAWEYSTWAGTTAGVVDTGGDIP